MTVLTDPTKWTGFGGSPPFWWQSLATDNRWWFYDDEPGSAPGNDTTITIINVADLPASMTFSWEITVGYAIGGITFRSTRNGVNSDVPLGTGIGSGQIVVPIPSGTTSFSWSLRTEDFNRMYGGVISIGDLILPTCEEIGRATRAYVSAYDRSRVHQSRLYRFEKRCLVANFNGAIPPSRTIISATWRTDAPEIGVISNPQISTDARESMVTFASQLGGWANLRCEVTLDNGEIYNQVFRVNVREASYFFNDPPSQVGPFSVTVTV